MTDLPQDALRDTGGRAEYVLALLIAAGYVTQAKADEARRIAFSSDVSSMPPANEQSELAALRQRCEDMRATIGALLDKESSVANALLGLPLAEGEVAAITALRQRCEEAETRVEQLQGVKFSDRNYGAMKARVEQAERDQARWQRLRASCEPTLMCKVEIGDTPSLRKVSLVQVDYRTWDELANDLDAAERLTVPRD
jgi:hypothetical protein